MALLAGDSFASGLEIQELAEDMASRFTVDVLLGDDTVEEDVEVHISPRSFRTLSPSSTTGML